MESILLFGMPDVGEWIIILVFIIASGLLTVLPLIAVIDLVGREFQGTDKVFWVLVVLFLPLLGSILYFVVGRERGIKRT
jgi:uncharacterized membrane protein